MVGLEDATIQSIETTLRCPLLDVCRGGNFCGIQLQLPQANHQQPFAGTQLTLLDIELVQAVNMANCWSTRTAQGKQLKRCSPLSHRSRGSTASLPQRGHVTPSGQRTCRK